MSLIIEISLIWWFRQSCINSDFQFAETGMKKKCFKLFFLTFPKELENFRIKRKHKNYAENGKKRVVRKKLSIRKWDNFRVWVNWFANLCSLLRKISLKCFENSFIEQTNTNFRSYSTKFCKPQITVCSTKCSSWESNRFELDSGVPH